MHYGGTIGVDLCTSSCAIGHPSAVVHEGGELLRGHLDVVTLQAAVELKPREPEERGGSRLVTMRRW
jgi:hypothetical protein